MFHARVTRSSICERRISGKRVDVFCCRQIPSASNERTRVNRLVTLLAQNSILPVPFTFRAANFRQAPNVG
jgi:hypothetical protein